jgi:hypothetical protein
MLVGLVNLWTVANGGLSQHPEDQRLAATQQLQTLAAQPGWATLLGAWERLCSVPIQIAFSVVVLQVFRRGKLIWLLWAVLDPGPWANAAEEMIRSWQHQKRPLIPAGAQATVALGCRPSRGTRMTRATGSQRATALTSVARPGISVGSRFRGGVGRPPPCNR